VQSHADLIEYMKALARAGLYARTTQEATNAE
jgi:hypothetical protein